MVGNKVNVSGSVGRTRAQSGASRTQSIECGATPARTPEERHRLIEQAAYLRAAARNFVGGEPVQDWLEAERDLDASIGKESAKGR